MIPARLRAARAVALLFVLLVPADLRAQNEARDSLDDVRGAFTFAVVGTTSPDDRAATMMHAAADGSARFVVHFDVAGVEADACSDAATERRRALLDAVPKPVVPVVAGNAWTACEAGLDPLERLEHVDDALFGTDESLGRRRLPWLRQSAVPRFSRYRENVRWIAGRVLFATLNLPEGNNHFRRGAGRNGEFEDRVVADRAWLARNFRLAAERRLSGVVLFVDGAPRFGEPLRAPDARAAERDGYYEFKLALREHASTFKGTVLLVQGHRAQGNGPSVEIDRPLKDIAGKPIANLLRIHAPDAAADGERRLLRVDVDPSTAEVFRVHGERLFDDPSGELYGSPHVR